jgi:hypothetical protein
MIWGALKRLGYQPGIINDKQFDARAYTNSPALLLSRVFQMNPLRLQRLFSDVLPSGIHIHAQADLPGQFDPYGRPNMNWSNVMRGVFGIDVGRAVTAFDLIVTNDCYSPIQLRGTAALGPISSTYAVELTTWKFWKNVAPASAQVILTAFGFPQHASQPNCPYVDLTPYPALLINSAAVGRAKTAINPFALGDTGKWGGTARQEWDTRFKILQAIYRYHFGLLPTITLNGPGSEHVLPMYRICRNGSVLIGLLTEDTNTATLTIAAPTLLQGRVIEDLSNGGVLTTNSTGTITYTNKGDECTILYAYRRTAQQDDSLINLNRNKVWFESSPLSIWPTAPSDVRIGFDTQDPNLALRVTLEQVSPHRRVFGSSDLRPLAGRGSLLIPVPVPDADANDPGYLSSHNGAQYIFRASLIQSSISVSEASIPVRLLFGVYPIDPLPSALTAGQTYQVRLGWEELPSYLTPSTPIDRAALWDSRDWGKEHYRVVLELWSGNTIVVSNRFLTSSGTSNATFSVTVPQNAVGPFSWRAYLQTATNVFSRDVEQSFEGYTRGARWQGPNLPFLTNVNFFAPWTSYVYGSQAGVTLWLNEGVHLVGSDGSQSAFMVVTNPSFLSYSGFGLIYEFTNGNWALPSDRSRWTNYTFSYDFTESHGHLASVDMQVKDANNNWIEYSTRFDQPSNSWLSVKASLDRFRPPPPGASGPFDPQRVHAIVLNVQMLTPGGLYVGSFDNVRFNGPDVDVGGGDTTSVYTSGNDSLGWLSVMPAPPGASIFWVGGGILEYARQVGGPWAEVTNATNPYLVQPETSPGFFRLRR